MAGFRMHVTTSTVLGCGYAAAGHFAYGLPPATAVVGGALCGFAGMLPDLDSDYGVPLRETMAFTAAVAPMLLVNRFQSLALSYDAMVLVAVSMYLFVRFGITKMIRKHTVHRGMFHSVPTGLIFAGLAFLLCGANDFPVRAYKAGGVFGGFMSHLILDEIYAVEWKSAWRFKKSFGTAVKFFGDDGWANFSTYAKLLVVAVLILGEPSAMQQLELRYPEIAAWNTGLQQRLDASGTIANAAHNAVDAARSNTGQFFSGGEQPNFVTQQPIFSGQPPTISNQQPLPDNAAAAPFGFGPIEPPTIRSDFGTARRPGAPFD